MKVRAVGNVHGVIFFLGITGVYDEQKQQQLLFQLSPRSKILLFKRHVKGERVNTK